MEVWNLKTDQFSHLPSIDNFLSLLEVIQIMYILNPSWILKDWIIYTTRYLWEVGTKAWQHEFMKSWNHEILQSCPLPFSICMKLILKYKLIDIYIQLVQSWKHAFMFSCHTQDDINWCIFPMFLYWNLCWKLVQYHHNLFKSMNIISILNFCVDLDIRV